MNRILYLDLIRILACLMIIAMHAPIPGTDINSYVLCADSLLSFPGIGLFIMVSGALVLPVELPTAVFLRKRFTKIIIPTFIWTLFYMVVMLVNSDIDESEALHRLLSTPFMPQFNATFWFVYMLVGLYLLAPIISPWLKGANKGELEFYLIIWGITMCYPLIRGFVNVEEAKWGISYYFEGFIGYFLLGYYLRNYAKDIAFWKCLLLLCFPIVVAIIMKVEQIPVDFYDMFWYLSVFVAMMSVAWFAIIKKVNLVYNSASSFHQILAFVSNCCFGIYLVHIFMMRSIIWHWEVLWNLKWGGQIVAVTLLTFIGSLIVTWLISYLPYAEYIIGFRQKK